LHGTGEAEGEAVATEQVGLARRCGQQPLEGAGRALAQHRDAGHQEHDDEGEDPQHDQSDRVEDAAAVGEERVDDDQEQHRHHQQHGNGAVIVS
jgi:hypothetical protein